MKYLVHFKQGSIGKSIKYWSTATPLLVPICAKVDIICKNVHKGEYADWADGNTSPYEWPLPSGCPFVCLSMKIRLQREFERSHIWCIVQDGGRQLIDFLVTFSILLARIKTTWFGRWNSLSFCFLDQNPNSRKIEKDVSRINSYLEKRNSQKI